MGATLERGVSYRQVFAVTEFRALWCGLTVSMAGDSLAQVAIAILVFQRTHSALATAVTYSLFFLPPIAGGPVLSALADLLPRRAVMIGADLVRIALVTSMAVPGLPIWALDVLLIAVTLAGVPFSAAQAGLGPVILKGDMLPLGMAITTTTNQLTQIAGFITGAVVVAATGARHTLLLDAATFAVSAVTVALWVRSRPRASGPGHAWLIRPAAIWAHATAGVKVVFGDPTLRLLIMFGWLSAAFVVPEALAAPYAHALGQGTAAVGLLLAAPAAGLSIGAGFLVRRTEPASRAAVIGWLAVLSFVPLIAAAAKPPLLVVLALWLVSGACSSYQIVAMSMFAQRLTDATRGTAFGFAASAVLAAQGLGLITGGALAQAAGPQTAVAAAGLAGFAAAVVLTRAWAGRDREP